MPLEEPARTPPTFTTSVLLDAHVATGNAKASNIKIATRFIRTLLNLVAKREK
jgi:hypothetical protein